MGSPQETFEALLRAPQGGDRALTDAAASVSRGIADDEVRRRVDAAFGEMARRLHAQGEALGAARRAGQLGLALLEKNHELTATVESLTTALRDSEKARARAEAGAGKAAAPGEVDQLRARAAELEGALKASREDAVRTRRAREEAWDRLRKENSYLTESVRSMRRPAPSGDLQGGNEQPQQQQQQQEQQADKKPGKASQFTLRRQRLRAEEDRLVLDECAEWVGALAGVQFASADDMLDEMATGVLLCGLLHRIDAGMVLRGRVHKAAKPGSMFAHDNLQTFLDGCRRLGVPEHKLFSTGDLVAGSNPRAVGYCLLALARAAVPYGVEPPELVRLEMEIERARLTNPRKFRARTQSEAHRGMMAGFSEYKPARGDKVDAHVAAAVNQARLEETPERIAAGEYRFGASHVFVREHRGVPLVRVGDHWQNLASFVGERAQDVERDRRATLKAPKDLAKILERGPPGARGAAGGAGAAAAAAAAADTDPSEKKDGSEEEEDLGFAYEVSAHKEFFFLTALSVKMQHALKEEDIWMVSTEQLFDKAVAKGVPFHEFYSFIEQEITKAYLEAVVSSRRQRLDDADVRDGRGNLRAHRKRTMSQLANRPRLRSHTHAVVTDQSRGIVDMLGDLFGYDGVAGYSDDDDDGGGGSGGGDGGG